MLGPWWLRVSDPSGTTGLRLNTEGSVKGSELPLLDGVTCSRNTSNLPCRVLVEVGLKVVGVTGLEKGTILPSCVVVIRGLGENGTIVPSLVEVTKGRGVVVEKTFWEKLIFSP